MHELLPQHARSQSLREEIANAISHGIGLIAVFAASPFLIISAVRKGSIWAIVGACVFAATMALLYLTSTLYHACPAGRAKGIFRVLDHEAIYFLIAGTYTPFTLGVLHGPWGWTLLGLVWGLAVFGVAMKATGSMRCVRLSTGLYVAMGWLIIIAIRPLWSTMPLPGLLWLLGGGIAYTGGVAFFVAERVRYSHMVWHFFVIAGTTCHFLAVLWYA